MAFDGVNSTHGSTECSQGDGPEQSGGGLVDFLFTHALTSMTSSEYCTRHDRVAWEGVPGRFTIYTIALLLLASFREKRREGEYGILSS
jgi:hypothetical protein